MSIDKVSIEKIQKFLRNKHKFDPKSEIYDVLEKINDLHTRFKEALNSESVPDLRKIISSYIIEIIMISNRFDIDIPELLSKEFNLN
ncbi:MAG: hypothetical protein ACTSVZ_03765 [Promethearchaeota archaeon]